MPESSSSRSAIGVLVDRWEAVCTLSDLPPGAVMAARVGHRCVAVAHVVVNGKDLLFAVGNIDPLSHTLVIARGSVTEHNGIPIIRSPINQYAYDLRSGICLNDPRLMIPTYQVRGTMGLIEVCTDI